MSATRAERRTWAGSTTTGWASTIGSRSSRARWGWPNSSTWRTCSRHVPAWPGWYAEALAGVEGLDLPCQDAGGERRSWFVYVVQLPRGVDRDATIGELRARGIDSKPYLPAIHLMSFYRDRFGHREGEFPVCEDVAARSLALPCLPTHRSSPSASRRCARCWLQASPVHAARQAADRRPAADLLEPPPRIGLSGRLSVQVSRPPRRGPPAGPGVSAPAARRPRRARVIGASESTRASAARLRRAAAARSVERQRSGPPPRRDAAQGHAQKPLRARSPVVKGIAAIAPARPSAPPPTHIRARRVALPPTHEPAPALELAPA